MLGHSNDGFIGLITKTVKFSGSISAIRCVDINHLNEHTVVGIKFGTITSQKSNMGLINAIFHDDQHIMVFSPPEVWIFSL